MAAITVPPGADDRAPHTAAAHTAARAAEMPHTPASASSGPPGSWPTQPSFAVFDSKIGPCGIAWGPRGITGVALPDPPASAMRDRLAESHPDAVSAEPPEPVRRVIERIRSVLDGSSRDDLADIELDMEGLSEFLRRAYAAARTIGPGHTMTYGQLAERIGNRGLARAVGRAMGANPFPIIVPCHRVLGADGAIGGFSAPGGAVTKRRMLLAEGIAERDGPGLFDTGELYPSSAL